VVSVLANKIGNKKKKVVEKIRKLDMLQVLFNYTITFLYVEISVSLFLLSLSYLLFKTHFKIALSCCCGSISSFYAELLLIPTWIGLFFKKDWSMFEPF
jgi:hypothetical protein